MGILFIFDLKERNCIISDLVLKFNVSAITGRSGDATNYPHFSPATFRASKIILVVNNVTIDTLYAVSNFINQQFFFEDDNRLFCSNIKGSYSSVIQRGNLWKDHIHQ